MAVSLAQSNVPSSLESLIQQNLLERMFHDALYPRQLYRSEAEVNLWQANLGERMIFTRTGLITPNTTALTPGTDPLPGSYDTEQWVAEASQHAATIDTAMPSDYVTLASLFTRNTKQLGLNAGQTLDRLCRNKLFTAYLSGEASVTQDGSASDSTIAVSTINGFTEQLLNGRLDPVSTVNAISISFTNGEPSNTVVSAVPSDPAVPNGPGILTLGTPLSGAVPARTGVLASTRARRLRVGGSATVDGLTGADIVTLDDLNSAVSRLRQNNIPPHEDGLYHVHMEPEVESQIFRDNQWQRLHQSLPESFAYRELAIGQILGTVVYRNTESPSLDTVRSVIPVPGGAGGAVVAPEIGAEVVNANGLKIRRTIVTGGGALYEKYLDESRFITEAGVQGKIGNFSVTNNGVAVMTDRIRFMIRSPQDRMQQIVSQTWSWSGDFPIPSDQLTGDDSRYKRAVVIESA